MRRRAGQPATVVVYGSFTCPYSFLASQRVDQLRRSGAVRIEWRAVRPDDSATDAARWKRELAEVATAALPREVVPGAPPPVLGNPAVAVAAYAGVARQARPWVRRALFDAIWLRPWPTGRSADAVHLLDVVGLANSPQSPATRRVLLWRTQWLALPRPIVPAVVRPESGMVTVGLDALAYLAGLLPTATRHPRSA